MIIPVKELIAMPEFAGIPEAVLQKKLNAVEQLIRSYTNNNFQNRYVRFQAASKGDVLQGASPFLKVNDTVQISKSFVNDGLYVITEIQEGSIKLDTELFEVPLNLVTKIEYPEDVKSGVLNLMIWEVGNRQKVGIKSETLSRHSVTYYDQDINNSVMGYPVALLGFLKPYIKPRF